MNYTEHERQAAAKVRDLALFFANRYEATEVSAATIALLAEALEQEIKAHGGNPDNYKFFTRSEE